MMMFILIRASLPRPRYDQVMSVGWKVCLPLTLNQLAGNGGCHFVAGAIKEPKTLTLKEFFVGFGT
ncbi:hypothetical protein A8275_27220 [Salmonella enterica subsp. enterica serovar Typhimurium]|nr:hypothetical protein A8275_27220 [Salmonella enterica subsp. enterica serovar Typhimurium]